MAIGIGALATGIPALGAASAAAGTAAAGISTATLISGAITAASALSSIGSGIVQARGQMTEAKNLDYQAKAAELEGRRQALLELEEFNRSQARRVAAIGASNIGFGGSAISALDAAEDDVRTDMGLIRSAARAQAAGYRFQGKALRKSARMGVVGGLLSAGSTAAGFALKKKQDSQY